MLSFKSAHLEQLKKQRRQIFLRKAVFYFVCLVALFFILSLVSKIKGFAIKDVAVSGASVISTDEIKSAVQKDISGNYLHLFSKKNIFIYPKNKIERDLRDNFKRIKNLNVAMGEHSTLDIKLTEQNQEFLWCADAIKCYFLNKDGLIFSEAPFFSGDVYFKFFTTLSSADAAHPIGAKVFSPETMAGISDLINSLPAIGLKSISLSSDLPGSFAIALAGANSPKLLIKEKSDFTKIYNNLSSALNTEPLKTKIKENYASLKYIDLRFENKVYYKFSQ